MAVEGNGNVFTSRNLSAPVEQSLGTNLVLVIVNIVSQTAEGHELGHQHELRREADGEELEEMGMFHARHDVSFVQELLARICSRPLSQHFDGHRDLDVLSVWNPNPFVDRAKGPATQNPAFPQLFLLYCSELGKIGLDVGGTERFVGIVGVCEKLCHLLHCVLFGFGFDAVEGEDGSKDGGNNEADNNADNHG